MKKFIKFFDAYGKEPNLYYKGEETIKSIVGGIFSMFYLLICLLYSIYKFYRFYQKVDFTTYDTFSYQEEEIPSIQLSKDNFYGGFGLENHTTYDPIIDETIYYPKAYFKIKNRRNQQVWNFTDVPIELGKCNLSDFGEFFQSKFKDNALNNLYCFKNLSETLLGHFSYDYYSYIYIELYPCKNTTASGEKCKPKEVIDSFLKATFLCMEFQDVELDPQNYSIPVLPRNQDIYFKVGKNQLQEVHIFYQILNIETDEDPIGIDEIPQVRKNQYLKYHSTYQMPVYMERNESDPFCTVTIKLYDQIRTNRRTYTKILQILGDIGGIRDALSSIIAFFLNAPLDLLYNINIINDLFVFSIGTKQILNKREFHRNIFNNVRQKFNEKIFIFNKKNTGDKPPKRNDNKKKREAKLKKTKTIQKDNIQDNDINETIDNPSSKEILLIKK